MWFYFYSPQRRINLCLIDVTMMTMDVHDNAIVDEITNRRRTPGNASHGFFDMLSDTTAPPQVGPFVWMLFALILYTYRGDRMAAYALLVTSSALHIMYVEYKRHESTTQQGIVGSARNQDGYARHAPAGIAVAAPSAVSAVSASAIATPLAVSPSAVVEPLGLSSAFVGTTVRYILHIAQIAIVVLVILFSESTAILWLLMMMQLSLCVAYYLDHASQISRVRRAYCETDTTGGGSKACRMQF
jgi:hypothetical protein